MIDFKRKIIWFTDPDDRQYKGDTVHQCLEDFAKENLEFDIRWNGDPWDEVR